MSPLLPPNSTLKTNEDFPDVCLASNFRPNAGTLSMNSCGRQMSTNITGTISLVKKSYYFAAFSNETMDYCMADGTFSNHRNIDICEIIHPAVSHSGTGGLDKLVFGGGTRLTVETEIVVK
ncbi:hypothetical protein FQA47_002924 [Oryzias melastigma]|uniref:Uncharacterized protein n=1 Tax=Oryzias melastigma TaxID=30732 RepID=A0A834F701_ORYME|nr:hypothetical protein FQA47_002924 [Oryzias melastigma]